MSARDLVIGSFNLGKVGEVRDALKDLSLTIRYLPDFPKIFPVPETAQTYSENAILKAKGYAGQTRLLTLADDSGLEVDAFGGRPGVFSARFGGADASDNDRINLLLEELADRAPVERTARFVCYMALARSPQSGTDPEVLALVEGSCEGTIANAPAGTNGFGFDPVFIPQGYTQTFAELPNEVKASISHRAKALAQIRTFLNDWLSVA
jgi:XTP/dITP diphosphohydrolase